ncbi:hypothetical protein ACFX11_017726 [Malus domestica]
MEYPSIASEVDGGGHIGGRRAMKKGAWREAMATSGLQRASPGYRGRALWVGSGQSHPSLRLWPTWMGGDWDEGFSLLGLGIGTCRSTSPESLSALLELG